MIGRLQYNPALPHCMAKCTAEKVNELIDAVNGGGSAGSGLYISLGHFDTLAAANAAIQHPAEGNYITVSADLIVYYFNGTAWVNVGTLRGKDGVPGPQGEPGPKGDPLKFEDLTPDQINMLVLSIMYPVGIIVPFANDINPNNVWGGSWSLIEEGHTLVQAGSTYKLGTKGGEAEITLTVDQLPEHTHYFHEPNNNVGAATTDFTEFGNAVDAYYGQGQFKMWSIGDKTAPAGSSQPHNNMPPYLAVNLWVRTA